MQNESAEAPTHCCLNIALEAHMVESPDITWTAPLNLDAELLATAGWKGTKDHASCLQLSQLALLAFLSQ